jgi:hypothetical protein
MSSIASVVYRLGRTALRSGGDDGVQRPLAGRLPDEPCHRVGHLLRVRRRAGSVLREELSVQHPAVGPGQPGLAP